MKEQQMFDPQVLVDLVSYEMPFGKYKGTKVHKLPVSYLEWFERKGFPSGKLGMMLQTMFVIKSNGLEGLLRPLIGKDGSIPGRPENLR